MRHSILRITAVGIFSVGVFLCVIFIFFLLNLFFFFLFVFFFQAEDGIRDLVRSRGLGDVYKRQVLSMLVITCPCALSLSVPLAITASTNALSKNGFIVLKDNVFDLMTKLTLSLIHI